MLMLYRDVWVSGEWACIDTGSSLAMSTRSYIVLCRHTHNVLSILGLCLSAALRQRLKNNYFPAGKLIYRDSFSLISCWRFFPGRTPAQSSSTEGLKKRYPIEKYKGNRKNIWLWMLYWTSGFICFIVLCSSVFHNPVYLVVFWASLTWSLSFKDGRRNGPGM